MSVKQSNDISKLSGIINELHSSVTSLTTTIKSLQSSITNRLPSNINNNTVQQESLTNKVHKVEQVQSNHKFNVVIYGIKECGKGTPRQERLNHDLDKVTSIVTEGENSINPLSIRDLLRLGKYREQSKQPPPVLVKLNQIINVTLVLSKA